MCIRDRYMGNYFQKMMCGGFAEFQPANEEVQEIANSLKAEIEEKLQNAFEKFKAIEYQTQVVAGTNFKIKISVDDEKQILVKIYRPLPCYQQPLQLTEANFI
eukprot:TRINITY_DN9911_c0_g2_i1.p2 TRINITY_DN9911_c0_g2~~TRINITY_DN9911_c0_g2_i1.p2  ORF type:complete len:103 (-),score=29.28 TRINITY_DN9911_c0_g2_i1:195-503(-)